MKAGGRRWHSERRSSLVGCLESSVTLFFATVAIAALKKFDVGPAMPAFFRLALTTVAVKSLLPNFPHNPLVSTHTVYRSIGRNYANHPRRAVGLPINRQALRAL